MVYYAHATTPIAFGFFYILYYLSIPTALLSWYLTSFRYIQKRNFKLKRLATYLLLAVLITSFSSYKLTSTYLYLHSPDNGVFCMTASCMLSSPPVVQYEINTESLKDAGLPSPGPMMIYRIYDIGNDNRLGLPVRMDYIAVVRPLIILPATEVTVYKVSGTRVTQKKSFLVVWPESPGSVLEKNLGVKFTVLILANSGGEGD